MAISYNEFIKYLDSKGLSLNQLRRKNIITQHTYEKMIAGEPVNLKYIDAICQYLNMPIEQVVKIEKDE